MRWIIFAILLYLALVAQNLLQVLVHVSTDSFGPIAPDILAAVGVFAALNLRNVQDVTIACWLLGIGLDLTTGGGAGEVSVVGPMALAYCAAGYSIFKIRDAFFRDRAGSQMILSGLFALLAHGLWVLLQAVLAAGSTSGSLIGRMLVQACLLALYTALAAPLVFAVLRGCERWLISPALGRGSRER